MREGAGAERVPAPRGRHWKPVPHETAPRKVRDAKMYVCVSNAHLRGPEKFSYKSCNSRTCVTELVPVQPSSFRGLRGPRVPSWERHFVVSRWVSGTHLDFGVDLALQPDQCVESGFNRDVPISLNGHVRSVPILEGEECLV